MNDKIKVCAIVVTFNRKELLLECLQGLLVQSRPLDAILIIDNASTDNTAGLLMESGYLSHLPVGSIAEPYAEKTTININLTSGFIQCKTVSGNAAEQYDLDVHYIRMHENTGGAGGFYEGVGRGYELGFDWLWLMDDDGQPKSDALEKLLNKKTYGNFLNSLVLNKNEKSNLSFGLFDKVSLRKIQTHSEALNVSVNGLIYDAANPFNGTFISRKLIENVGYPMKEMFIWGDEVEYQLRASKSELGVATVVDAIHFHPEGRVETVEVLGGRYNLNYQRSELKNYCDMRNRAYIQWRYGQKTQMMKCFLAFTYYFLTRMMVRQWFDYLKASFDGVFSVWGKEKRFLK